MKVAILGASGWIGSHLAAEAKMRGHEVVAVVRDPAKVTLKGVAVQQLDIPKPRELTQICARRRGCCDCLYRRPCRRQP